MKTVKILYRVKESKALKEYSKLTQNPQSCDIQSHSLKNCFHFKIWTLCYCKGQMHPSDQSLHCPLSISVPLEKFAKHGHCRKIVGSTDITAAMSTANLDNSRFTLKCMWIHLPLCSEHPR